MEEQMSEQKVSEALRVFLYDISLLPDAAATELASREIHKVRDLALQLEQGHARLLAQIEAMTEPGKASGIIRALFELAEQECGHKPIMAQHPLTSLKGWISETKKENAQLTAQVAELQNERKLMIPLHEAVDLKDKAVARKRDELQKQLDALQADKVRLDWLDECPESMEFVPADFGSNIREAIDAARTAQESK